MNSHFTLDSVGNVIPVQDYLASLGPDILDSMQAAADDLVECERILAKSGDTIVTELLRHERIEPASHTADFSAVDYFSDGRHIPDGDVYDPISHSQYYFHVHRDERSPEGTGVSAHGRGEIGHFHTFLRQPGMPDGIRPISPCPDQAHEIQSTDPLDKVSHLVAIAFADSPRLAGISGVTRLFSANRWVTGENWYAGEDVIGMLGRFEIDLARPSWPANRWITAVMRLFRPQTIALIRARDKEVERLKGLCGGNIDDVLNDRRFSVLSEMCVSVESQIEALRAARRALRRARGTPQSGP
jgi:hypothetical protein